MAYRFVLSSLEARYYSDYSYETEMEATDAGLKFKQANPLRYTYSRVSAESDSPAPDPSVAPEAAQWGMDPIKLKKALNTIANSGAFNDKTEMEMTTICRELGNLVELWIQKDRLQNTIQSMLHE